MELAIRKGATLLIIVDPVRPVTIGRAGYAQGKGGFFSIIQGIKSLMSSRFEQDLAMLRQEYPGLDFLMFRPFDREMVYLGGSPMKYEIRLDIITRAFDLTMKQEITCILDPSRQRDRIVDPYLAAYPGITDHCRLQSPFRR